MSVQNGMRPVHPGEILRDESTKQTKYLTKFVLRPNFRACTGI